MRSTINSFSNSRYQSPQRTTLPDYLSPSTLKPIEMSNKYKDFTSYAQQRPKSKKELTKMLMQGSAKKQERMLYADKNDHSFNNSRRFTNRQTSEFIIASKRDPDAMPEIKSHLPRVSPLSIEDEDELVTVLKDIIQHEKELEEAKIDLIQQQDFNLTDAFHMLDTRTNGWITAPQLHDCLHMLGFYCHKDDTNTFLRRFDFDSDGRLLYSDFCDAFTPRDAYFSDMLNSRHTQFLHTDIPRTNYFHPQTRDKIFACFKVHFEVEESLEHIKKRLARRPKFNFHDAYKYLDFNDDGFLCKDNFKKVLLANKCYISDGEVNLLADRFDKNRNGKITYNEFIEEIMPKNSYGRR